MAATGADHLSFQLAACKERDLAADLAGVQGTKQATKLIAQDAARRKGAAQSQTTAMGTNPLSQHPSSSWLVDEVEKATPNNTYHPLKV